MSLAFITPLKLKLADSFRSHRFRIHRLHHHLSAFYKIVFIKIKSLCRSS